MKFLTATCFILQTFCIFEWVHPEAWKSKSEDESAIEQTHEYAKEKLEKGASNVKEYAKKGLETTLDQTAEATEYLRRQHELPSSQLRM